MLNKINERYGNFGWKLYHNEIGIHKYFSIHALRVESDGKYDEFFAIFVTV